ncbi:phage holin family protein [Paenibacillus agricola]|uniref:Phage holin family protein n=1 Tax=Paenibacillus agricola TaxID=2716264 RepID=A0ABX0J3A2_9BACL|nr:phage holin family protein [Paenibacillus agricola]NHN28601.1 phage holin family protein [Paenibacillus agricola]
MTRETTFSSILALVGLIVNSYLGGWDIGLKILIFCMIFDYITGVLGAIKERNLDSEVMFWGGIRKSVILMVLVLSVLLDELVGNTAPVFRTLAIYFYISREGLSVVENLGVLGVPLPDFIRKVLAQLDGKSNINGSGNGEEKKKDDTRD